MAKRIIVKVQLPLFASDGNGMIALVYNEDQSIMQELPLRSKKEYKELRGTMGDEPKGYFYAKFDGKGLILTEEAPWQDW